MPQFVAKRLLASIPTFFGVILLTFLIVRLAPGDPARLLVGERATEGELERVRSELGLDQSTLSQLGIYLQRLIIYRDMGQSIRTSSPVTKDLGRYFPATVELTTVALGIACFLGVGCAAMIKLLQKPWCEKLLVIVSQIGVSVPIFWLGLIAILIIGVYLQWLPFDGRMDVRLDLEPVTGLLLFDSVLQEDWLAFRNALAHLALPALTLSLVPLSFILRISLLELDNMMDKDFIRTASAKGLSRGRIIFKHALKPSAIPIVTVAGTQFGYLLGGAVLTESIFQWPGIGRYVVDSVSARDFPAIQGAVLLIACSFVLVNLLADITYGVLDPRVREGLS